MASRLPNRLLSIKDTKSIFKVGQCDFLKGPINAKNAIERIKNKKIKEKLLAKQQINSTPKPKDKPVSRYLEFVSKKNAFKKYRSVRPRLIENPKSFSDHVNNQDVLHQGSKLNRRAFLLNMINKRSHGLPTLSNASFPSSQENTKRVKFIDLEKVWQNENSFPKDYDPNWRDRENLPNWLKHKFAIQERTMFQKWCPKKRVPREVMDKIRLLYHQSPEENTPQKLSQQFKISPESVRRILHSKFVPTPEVSIRQNQKILGSLIKFKAEMKAKRKEENKLIKQKKKKWSKDALPAVKKPKQKRDRFLKVLNAVQK
ncbi:2459_t:CDS:2, partial [Cetraspora pellucida]